MAQNDLMRFNGYRLESKDGRVIKNGDVASVRYSPSESAMMLDGSIVVEIARGDWDCDALMAYRSLAELMHDWELA